MRVGIHDLVNLAGQHFGVDHANAMAGHGEVVFVPRVSPLGCYAETAGEEAETASDAQQG